MGYSRAGFDDIVGVDIVPQPRYPFSFVQADALEYLAEYGQEFDAIHASPPCQGYSIMHNLPWLRGREYPLLILPTREMLDGLGLPYIIENVMGARYGAKGLQKRGIAHHGMKAGWLCGGMFGLPLYRHRLFETNFAWLQPGHPKHKNVIRGARTMAGRARDFVFSKAEDARGVGSWPSRRTANKSGVTLFSPRPRGSWEQHYEEQHPGQSEQAVTATGLDRLYPDGTRQSIALNGCLQNWQQNGGAIGGHATYRHPKGFEAWRSNGDNPEAALMAKTKGWRLAAEAMGIDWMKREELTQAIPPAYTKFIGHRLLEHLR